MEWLQNLDQTLFLFFNKSVANAVFDAVMPFITNKHNFFVPILIIVLYFLIWGGKKGRVFILLMAITITLSDYASSSILKPWIGRLRPCHPDWMIEGGRFLLGLKKSLSFPSSHAANMGAMATLFTAKYRKIMWLPITFAVLVSYSRVYVGVHYPFDVVAGNILGVGCGLLVLGGEKLIKHLWFKKRTINKDGNSVED